jgi:hypothetical protein
VQYVQVKLLQTWKIAAFLVAFFSSFFSYGVDYSTLDGQQPKSISSELGVCELPTGNVPNVTPSTCKTMIDEHFRGVLSATHYNINLNSIEVYRDASSVYWSFSYTYQNTVWIGTSEESFIRGANYGNHGIGSITLISVYFCPPDSFPFHTLGPTGPSELCYNPADIQAQLEEQNELDRSEDYCKGLTLDTGNNTASNLCYSAPNGSQCSVSKVSGEGYSYYKGTDIEVLGCGSSEDSPYDQSGTGDEKDNCIYSDGVNYCKANEVKHCSDTNGITSCDEGCVETGDIVMCDISKHPDVGEGDSDFFDDKGTCSVIAASATKGFCEEMGGTWDTTQDYQATSCPIGSGTCSTGSTICGACIDEGGVWTPDANAQSDVNAINDVAARIDSSNKTLSAIEHGQRKTMEATVSTIKSGNGKIVAAIDALTKITKDKATGAAAVKEEKEKFTTTTGDIDKTKLSALYDDAHLAQLKTEIDDLQQQIRGEFNSIRAQASALLTVPALTTAGYQAMNVVLSVGTFDVSLSRFSDFFKMLAGPIMFICSIIAMMILLRGKKS